MKNFIEQEALKIATLNAQIKYLNELWESGDLSDDGEDYVATYTDILAESIENMELMYFNTDVDDSTIQKIYKMSEVVKVEVSEDFKNHVNRYI